ncbi:MAG: PAS domain S-box protein [Pseudomonadota bacterium]
MPRTPLSDSPNAGRFRGHLRPLIRKRPSAIYLLQVRDDRLVPVWVSKDISRITGYAADEVLASADWWTEHLHPTDRLRIVEKQSRLFEGERFAQEYRFRHKNGHYLWISDEAKLLRDAAGQPREIVHTWYDITDRKRLEETLHERDRTFRLMFMHSPLPMWVYDLRTLAFLEANEAAVQHYGYSREEFLDMRITDLCAPEDASKLLRDLQAARVVFPFSGECRHRRKDQRVIDVDMSSHTLDFRGHPAALVIAEDATTRRCAEEALRQSEARFRATFEQAAVGMAHSDPQGNFLQVNHKLCEILGYSAEELLRMHFVDITHPDDLQADVALMQQLLAGKIPTYTLEKRYIHKDGQLVWINLTVSLVRDPVGNPDYFIGVIEDITERKRGEEALRASEELLRTVLDNLPVGVWLADRTGHIFQSNQLGRRIWAGSKYVGIEHFGEYKAWWLESGKRIEPEEWAVARAIRKGEVSLNEEIEIECFDGTRKIILNSAVPIRDKHGEVIGAVSINQDISERKRAEAEVQRLNTDLEQRVTERTAALQATNQELEAFSYSVSHDLRAPLRAIDGFSRILLEEYRDRLDPEAQGLLERVRNATVRMTQLIDDLLSLAQVSRSEMHREPVDLSEIARSFAQELQSSQPQRQLEWVIAPAVVLHGDRRLLRIVLENLLRNAWKFTSKQAQARIEVGILQQDGQPVYFVRDNGAGFDMAYAHKLFGAFQRLHGTAEFAGTGIGLATVARIIHRHGGRIWAEGAVGQGATFYFTVPDGLDHQS